MQVIDLHPDFLTMPNEEIIKQIPAQYIVPLSSAFASYYDSKITMQQVYGIYGVELLVSEAQQQVQCLLPSHGTQDRHPSARFYPVDRNTGEIKHAVYCHKCQKTSTPFWLLYARESFLSGIHMRDLYLFIEKTFQIPFPKHIFFAFDPQEYFTFEETEVKSKLQRIRYAETLLSLKEAQDPLYLTEIQRFWQEV